MHPSHLLEWNGREAEYKKIDFGGYFQHSGVGSLLPRGG